VLAVEVCVCVCGVIGVLPVYHLYALQVDVGPGNHVVTSLIIGE